MTEQDITAIAARDTEQGALWFTGPASNTAMAIRDRRALLAYVRELEQRHQDDINEAINATEIST